MNYGLELIRTFDGVKDFRLDVVHAQDILNALFLADGGYTTDTTVLPNLGNFRFQLLSLLRLGNGPMPPLWDAAQLFITS